MARPAGLEPATCGLEVRCSNPAELRALLNTVLSRFQFSSDHDSKKLELKVRYHRGRRSRLKEDHQQSKRHSIRQITGSLRKITVPGIDTTCTGECLGVLIWFGLARHRIRG